MWWVFSILMGSLALVAVLLMRRRPAAGKSLVSIVLLRRVPGTLSEADVRGMFRRAGAGNYDIIPLPPIDGLTTGFAAARNEKPVFYVLTSTRTYCDNPDEESRKFEDPRGRAAYAEHKAWMSIDSVGGMPEGTAREPTLQLLAKMAAELVDHETTLIYSTWLGRFALPSEEAEHTLRGDSPMSLFGDEELNVPVIHASGEDQVINRAIAEAQRHYPTLVAAWKRSGAATHAIVKGRFEHDGHTEYMWLQVHSMDDVGVTGELGNDPVHVPDIKKGQIVTVKHEQVVDWACTADGKTLGMYVEKVLRAGSR